MNESDSNTASQSNSDSGEGVWMLKWRPNWPALWALLCVGAVLSWWIHVIFADALSDSSWTPMILWISALLVCLGLSDLLDLLNLQAPMRIEVISKSPVKLRVITRSLRTPLIEDHNMLRFSRSEEEALLYFLPGKRNRSIWFRPLFSWTPAEQRIRIRSRQFATTAEWDAFLSLLDGYPKKLESDVLAANAA